jgi:hypothetical protein
MSDRRWKARHEIEYSKDGKRARVIRVNESGRREIAAREIEGKTQAETRMLAEHRKEIVREGDAIR